MNKRNLFVGLAVAIIAVAGGVWFFFIRSDAPPPASLEDAVAAVTEDTTTLAPSGQEAATTAAPQTTNAPVVSDGLDGSWVVDQADSFAGYRIGEELASIGTTTAVGRTRDIEASLTFAGSAVTEFTVTVDMATLQSDRSREMAPSRPAGSKRLSFQRLHLFSPSRSIWAPLRPMATRSRQQPLAISRCTG